MGFGGRRDENWKMNLSLIFFSLWVWMCMNVEEGEEEIEERWWRKRKKSHILMVLLD